VLLVALRNYYLANNLHVHVYSWFDIKIFLAVHLFWAMASGGWLYKHGGRGGAAASHRGPLTPMNFVKYNGNHCSYL
jgi:hypothetical protein